MQIKVESAEIQSVKPGKQDARQSMLDNAHCSLEASEQPVEPGQCCRAKSDGTSFRAKQLMDACGAAEGIREQTSC